VRNSILAVEPHRLLERPIEQAHIRQYEWLRFESDSRGCDEDHWKHARILDVFE
jgi:hypothetical protein